MAQHLAIKQLIGGTWIDLDLTVNIPVTPPGAPRQNAATVFAAGEASGSNTFQNLDQRVAASIGTTTPLLVGSHEYSGNNFPATFSATAINYTYALGYRHGILNVKCDWTQLSDGTLDSYITTFAASIPSDFVLYLLINHEPENDNNPAGSTVWVAGQARAANLIASLGQDNLYMGICLMAFTWDPTSGRTPSDWNPAGTMTAGALQRTVFAPDGYTKARSATNIDDIADIFDPVWTDARSWGFQLMGISEHALNNDAGVNQTTVVNWWESNHLPYLESLPDLTYYAFYNHSGPAAGTSPYLDTTAEETMFGNFCVKHNR